MTRAYLDDHEGAIRFYEKALQIAPNEPAILSAMAASYDSLGNLVPAIFYAREARSREPSNREYHRQLAQLLVKSGDVDGAIDAYQSLLAQFPRDRVSLAAIARFDALRGKYRKAIAFL